VKRNDVLLKYRKLNVAFRLNANKHIATGHLMRCIAIANEFTKCGHKCIFIMSDYDEVYRLDEYGLKYVIIDSACNEMDSEVSKLEQILKKYKADLLVVDSYEMSKEYLEHFDKILPLVYIDDMCKQAYEISFMIHYDGMIDNNIKKAYQMNKTNTCIMEGYSYIPLRDEFQNIDDIEVSKRKNILITTGGTDLYNMSYRILKACESISDYEFHVIVGSMNEHKDKLKEYSKTRKNVYIHTNVTNISTYMLESEVAISTSGTTLLELCVCRVPTICFTISDNQIELANNLSRQVLVDYVGDVRNIDNIERLIKKSTDALINDKCKRKKYIENMKKIIDGRGVENIVRVITDIYENYIIGDI